MASLRIWSNNPPDDKLALPLGAVMTFVGAVLLCGSLAHLSGQPWDLAERGVETTGVKAERHALLGDRYQIEVEGESYLCYRGEDKLGRPEVTILYDPDDPSRCRAADTASRLGTYESTSWLAAPTGILMGLSLMLARLAEPRELWARKESEGLLRPKLMWVSRALLLLALLVLAFVLPTRFG